VSNPDDLIVRIESPSLTEREFIMLEARRRRMALDALFKFWMQEAMAAAKAGGDGEG
jgi:hypothetical protein